MTNSQATNLTIKGQLIANAPTFTTTSGNISSRTLTTAAASWVPTSWTTGTDYNSPSIVSVIQEIVDQGTWASGNAIAIILTGTGHRASQAYDTAPATAAKLVVTYTTYDLSGRVFEDVNYGGGAGRNWTTASVSGGSTRSAVRVELFDAGGAFVTSTTTDGSGNYTFSNLGSSSYTVRVVSASVTSSRSGYVAGLLPVLTYRTNAGSGTAVGVTDYVGGHDPATADAGNAGVGWTLTPASGAFSGSGSGKAHAFAPVTVSAANVTGVDFGWNFDTIVNTNNSGQGSLRQFITNANTLGGDASLAQSGLVAAKENAIFMISNGTAAAGLRSSNNYFSGSVATISPASALPTITTAMVIDAQKQPGWTLAPIVVLDGSATTGADGLQITAGNSTVRGLVINKFDLAGIYILTNGSNTIQGNFIGTNAAGTALAEAAGAMADGIQIRTANNIVGGTVAQDRNIVAGAQDGIRVRDATATGNLIRGNYAGTDVTGTLNLGNTDDGIDIGTGAVNNTIGGTGANDGNVVAFNVGDGVEFRPGAGTGNAILGNSIYSNGQNGIDFSQDGVTLNDGAKTAGNPNLWMDFPVFTSATLSGTTLTVAGYVGSAPNQATFANARVELFKSDNDPSGYGEGQAYLGFLTSDASGNFSGSLTVSGLAGGDRITGTATDGSNNTSEFGANVTAAAAAGVSISGTVYEDVNYGGGAGRDRASSSGVVRSGARVELYDNTGAYVTAVTTDGSGNYSFPGLIAGNYTVRVVDNTVTSSRGGSGLLPVLTYRTNAASGTAAGVTDYVGGQNPAVADAPNGAAGAVMNTTTGVFTAGIAGTAQSIAPVTISTGAVSGVDFGYNFDTVVNTNDAGRGSLRQFLTTANTLGNGGLAQAGRTAGIESAIFMISNGTAATGLRAANNFFSGGVATISPASALPQVTDPVILDAQTQPGWGSPSGPPIVEVNGSGVPAGSQFLYITAGGSTVRGLIINRYASGGLALAINGSNTIQGNYIGTNAAGTAAAANGVAGIRVFSSGSNLIGGTAAGQRNLLSGNGTGIMFEGATSGNTVAGNFVGTDAAGTAVIPNGSGIVVYGPGNTIGGTSAAARNVISGNTGNGLAISGAAATGNLVQGNFIGTDITGAIDLGNVQDGVSIVGGAAGNTIGGPGAGDRNIISGNNGDGVEISGASTGNNQVLGNFIGTDSTGTARVGNSVAGVRAEGVNNRVGGTAPGAGNVISGNSSGVTIGSATATGNVVEGNRIGTDVTGTQPIGNTYGVWISGGSGSVIGGAAPGAGNVIGRNTQAGVYLAGSGVTGNVVRGNFIGTDGGGALNLGNGSAGVLLGGSGTSGNSIGGTAAGEGNRIAFNGSDGVWLNDSGSANAVLGNAIYSNAGIGIDILNDGPTLNDGAKTAGLPNLLMDFPVFTSASLSGTTLTVAGYVGSAPNQSTFANARVEVFKSDNDGSGYGEGQSYLGFLTSNASGNFSGSLTVSGLAVGDRITGTATDNTNNTSEFGANVIVRGIANLVLTLTDNPDPAASGGELLYTLLITNNGPDTATGVVATNVLPAGVTFQSATPSQGSCSGTATVTCTLGTILSGSTASVEILVVTSGTGTITDNASVTANESDTVPGNNTASVTTQVVVGSVVDVPLALYRRIHGFVDSTVTGGSLRTGSQGAAACNVGASSTGAVSGIPASATVVGAYLYWAGSGTTVDSQVTLDGSPLAADRTFQARETQGTTTYDFFGGFKDVTGQVQSKRNGSYTFSGLSVDNGNPYCSAKVVIAGWSLFVIYQDASVSAKTLVLYDGFDYERNGSTSYLLSGIYVAPPPEAKATFLLWEGDENLGDTAESLVFNGSTLSDGLNPGGNVYNSTINSLGVSTSYGLDLDTFDVSSTLTARDTSASTTVSVGADQVILNAVLLQARTNIIAGTVFEDVNYGGGAGRDRTTAAGVVRSNARVELYDGSGNFVSSTTSGASGDYAFAALPDGNYTVRVVDNTVTSSRTGSVPGLWPVQTFRTDAGSGTAVAVTNEVGGVDPALQDAPANTTNQNLGSFLAQSKAPVRINAASSVPGVDFGFNFDTIVNTNDTGQGSLRQFLTNANTLSNTGLAQAGRPAGIESAIFMISNGTAAPGLRASLNYFSGGVATIAPATVLPTITDPVILDAQTQPGWTTSPVLELNGTGVGANVSGLTITAGNSTVRGFAINRFTGSNDHGGIRISGAGGNTIQGNYLGTDATGTVARPNYQGIIIDASSGNLIGGSAASQRNVTSGNTWRGIKVLNGTTGNTIQGNYVGTDATGTVALAGQRIGIYLETTPNNTVGGTGPGEGNVVSGNTQIGIYLIYPASSGNVIRGNTVGLNAARTAAIPNGSAGIELCCGTGGGASSNTIGGPAAGAGNFISGNTGFGIRIWDGTGNTIQANSIYGNGSDGVQIRAGSGNAILTNPIYGNGWIGIDLGNDNVTVNDGSKTAGQPNLYMDFPVFTSATLSGTTLTVAGYVGSAPGQATFAGARVEIFKSDNDGSGYGEGRTYLGFLTADASGNFSGSLTVSGLTAGDKITGTATDGSNNTSEFGANVTVAAPGYQPDAMIKLASEGAGAYATDNVYEATAATQVKSQGVVSATIATYNLLFQNDGNIPDNAVITQAAADNCANYTIQYLDNTATDRTAAVTGAGYTITGLAAGVGTTWTLRVTPPGTVNGGSPACRVSVTATSAGNGTKADQVRAITSSTSANLTLLKNADRGTVAPGQDITYTVNASNGAGLTSASVVVVTDPIPAYTGFKVGSATFSPGTSTLSGTPVYSSDNGATWAYGPASGGCAAPAGYDFCVTNVRWTTTGAMPQGTSFSVTFVVRVK